MKKWRIRDIIDLEYFLHRDETTGSAGETRALAERDRNIYLELGAPGPEKKAGRRQIIREWLERRRQHETGPDKVLPGEGFESLYGSFRLFFVGAGLVVGAGAGLSFLTYTGDRPLNVFVYLAVFVISQVLLVLLLPALALLRLKKKPFLDSSSLYGMTGRALLRLLLWAQAKVSVKLPAEQRLRAEALKGIIISRGRTYGLLFILPLFILAQLFAVGFNLGLLGASLFRVLTADIAFGWQSTLQLSPGAVHALVQKIALPWSWLVSNSIAYPSLAEIEGSRIILKEGIYHLATPDLISWWPFLCFSVLFYGLLPRLFLFLGAVVLQGRQLAKLDFRQGACEQLLLRMTTPLLSTSGLSPDNGSAVGELEQDVAGTAEDAAAARDKSRTLLAMVPDDMLRSFSETEFTAALQKSTGSDIGQVYSISGDFHNDADTLADLGSRSRSQAADILVVQEAWQPPITEYLDFIRKLRQAVGPEPCIRLGLTGKPHPGAVFTLVKDENRRIWDRKIKALGDPCIFITGLVNNAT